jgi:hypothetical protein
MQFFIYGFRSISWYTFIVLIYIGISAIQRQKKNNTAFPDLVEHPPRRMDVQPRGMRYKCQRPKRGGYNHVGDTTANANLIKSNGVWGIGV